MSEGRVLEMGDGKGNWWPIGTCSDVEGLGPVSVGTVGHCDHARFVGRDVVFWFEESADIDDKAFDVLTSMSISMELEMSEEDREKVLAMFGPAQIPLSSSVGYVEGVDCGGDRRGKKGKFKKDWMR
jgi:hypothetical protein